MHREARYPTACGSQPHGEVLESLEVRFVHLSELALTFGLDDPDELCSHRLQVCERGGLCERCKDPASGCVNLSRAKASVMPRVTRASPTNAAGARMRLLAATCSSSRVVAASTVVLGVDLNARGSTDDPAVQSVSHWCARTVSSPGAVDHVHISVL